METEKKQAIHCWRQFNYRLATFFIANLPVS